MKDTELKSEKECSINQIVWCDIPVVDLDRAIRFYSAVIGAKIIKEEMPDFAIGVLPHAGEGIGACLVKTEGNVPSGQGVLIYLNTNGRLDDAIKAAKANGGKILQEKHSIAPYGFRAVVLDSEGNRIALHSC